MFLTTPIAYPSNQIPEPWRTLAGLNPTVGVIGGFRWALLGSRSGGVHWSIAVSGAVILALLLAGLWFFRLDRETYLLDEVLAAGH